MHKPLTLLHISDMQFGRNHRFGQLGLNEGQDEKFDTLFQRLKDDIELMEELAAKPEAIIVSGDLVEYGKKDEFNDALDFLIKLTEQLNIPRGKVIIVPGNHDINRKLTEGYFSTCEGDGEQPKKPYWPKWKHYQNFFQQFYNGETNIIFTEAEPWTFYELGDLKLVVAGINSTIAESHLEEDHYGLIGETQLRSFAERFAPFRDNGWFRLGVVHHNIFRGAKNDEECLRDLDDLKRILGPSVNLFLHGHTHKDDLGWIDNRVPVISTGSAALMAEARPEEIGNQYQIIQLWADKFKRITRRYDPAQKRWIGDTRCSLNGDDWYFEKKVEFFSVHGAFPPQLDLIQAGQIDDTPERRVVQIDSPLDSVSASQKLKSLPRFRLRSEDQHHSVRNHEQKRLVSLLKGKRAAWLVADWGLGKEGFLACAIQDAGGADALHDVFRLQCGGVNNCVELLQESETQLGLSFQEFFAAVAAIKHAVLVFDDLPPAIVAGAERDMFEQKIRPIFDFCPELKLIFIARQEPKNVDANEIVLLRPLDIPETRKYLRNHARARPGLDNDFELERIHAWSGGLPMHLDRLLERIQFLSLSLILEEDTDQPSGGSSEPLPYSLKNIVAKLANADVKHTRQSFRLLKVLTILRDGETFQSIRRFYEREPFYQSNIDELVNLALLEDVPISQTAADLSIHPSSTGFSNVESPKLLRVPRQVRDHVNSLISTEQRAEIIDTSTGLFFGPKWWQGKIKLRAALSDAYGHSAIAGPGNEHLVAKHLLGKALEKGKKPTINRFAQLALAYCNKLISADRFRDVLIASSGIMDLLRDTEFHEHFVNAAHMNARALRMTNRERDAIEVLKSALERGASFLIDENKADIKLTLAFAYKDLKLNNEGIAAAKEVLELVVDNSNTAYEAKASIAEMTLTGVNLKNELLLLEQSARSNSHSHAANNIALTLAQKAALPEESLPLLQKVIFTSRDNYSRTRAIIEKATVLVKHSRVNELNEQDRILLSAAYSYSYGQRIGNLLDSCHTVLWSIFTRQQHWSSLIRLFRYSSFIWRLKGIEVKEKEYLEQLGSVDIEQLKRVEGKTLHIEILYLERRRNDHPIIDI